MVVGRMLTQHICWVSGSEEKEDDLKIERTCLKMMQGVGWV